MIPAVLTLTEAAKVTGRSTHHLRRAMIAGKLGYTRGGDGAAAPYLTKVADLIAAGYELQAPDERPRHDDSATIDNLRAQLDVERDRRQKAEKDAAEWHDMARRLSDSLDGLRALMPAPASQAPDGGEDLQKRVSRIKRLFGKA